MSLPQDAESAGWFENQILPHDAELRNFLHKIAPPGLVDDLVQETYIRVLKARTVSVVRSPRGLLFAIARNAARDTYRKSAISRTIQVAEIEEIGVLDDARDSAELTCVHQELSILEAAILSLPPRCREVLMLRKLEGLSHGEIASRLGITVHTVEAQLTNGLRRCQKFFEKRAGMKDRTRR